MENDKKMQFQVELTESQWMLLTRAIYPFSEVSTEVHELYTTLGLAKIVWR